MRRREDGRLTMANDSLERCVIDCHNIDENTNGEIEVMARDIKHARRLAKSRMDRKPGRCVYKGGVKG